jgi:hypothetical protein
MFKKIILALLISLFIFYLQTSSKPNTNYRTLQQDNYNNSTLIRKLYDDYCQNITAIDSVISNDKPRLKDIFKTVFENQALVAILIKLINTFGDDASLGMELTNAVLKTIIPICIILLLTFIGWTVCCSCCCYDYCPIVCKPKPNDSLETPRYISNVLVLFTGISLLIPAVFAFVRTEYL